MVHGEAVETESMVNIPNWLPMTLRIGDGPWLGQPGLDLLEERYELDLRGGQLTRRFQIRDAQSRVATVTQRRIVHRRLPNVCGLQTTITTHGWSGQVTLRSTVDPTIENRGVARYQGLSSRHLSAPLRVERVDGETVLCVVETSQSHVRIAMAARTRVLDPQRGCSRLGGWCRSVVGRGPAASVGFAVPGRSPSLGFTVAGFGAG
jgi:trehalose 6-phosphate phosphatase